MNVYHFIDDFISKQNAIVTIGAFDGVHVGHRAIINRLNTIAKTKNIKTQRNIVNSF